MPNVPQRREFVTHPYHWSSPANTADKNPQVTVSARTDRVLYGPKGEELIRIVDRPVGFRPQGTRRST